MFAFKQQVTFLYTPNLAATAQFYEQVLGLPMVLDQGTCRIYQVSQGGFVGVCESAGSKPPRPQSVIITLVTADVDGWYEKLQAKGVIFAKPPTYNPQFNIYHCFLHDPNGYLLEIQQFLDPAWPAG